MTFTYQVSAADWGRIAPELVLIAAALLVLLLDILLPKTGRSAKESGPRSYVALPALSLVGVLGALVATIILSIVGDGQRAFNEMIGSDSGSLYAYIIILCASGLGLLLSPAYLKRLNLVHQGEYYALFLLATLGMMLLAAATSFLTVFLGLEMLSLALYILCGFVSRRQSSQESGMKYFLLSSFASAFLLYGIALTYGATGNTSFIGVTRSLPASGHASTLLLVAMGLLAVGFAFKISAIPFQAWTPDVYEGAPAPVTAFMSVGTKAAALVAFLRVFAYVFSPVKADWLPVVETIAILTIVGGNILALVQSNVKRLLAYSSIAHAGYLMIGIIAASPLLFHGTHITASQSQASFAGAAAVLFYLLCYTFMNLGAFGVISLLERVDNSGSSLQDLRGLWYRRPFIAGVLAFFMLALAGFPPMAGFAAKYYIFYAALVGGRPELLIIGVLASILGIYYYLKVIASMFMERDVVVEPALATVPTTPTAATGATTVRRVPSTRLSTSGTGNLAESRGGAAVAVKPTTAGLPRATTGTAVAEEQGSDLNWLSWLSISIAIVGTLLMGTVLPFWLVDLANRAATTMLR